jgi:hypothetical protein
MRLAAMSRLTKERREVIVYEAWRSDERAVRSDGCDVPPPGYGAAMAIERFVWTDHALQRLQERGLTRFEVEAVIREGHDGRVPNEDGADWLIATRTQSGISIEAIYDHPHAGDETVVRIVSVWRLAGEVR